MIGWAVRMAAISLFVALLFFVVVQQLGSPTLQTDATTPTQTVTAADEAATPAHSGLPNSLTFRANSQGHVLVEASVNGAPVRFLVDTGSTMVALTMRDAAAAGFDPNDLDFNMRTSTANGVGRAASVTLRELRIGQLSVEDVPALVGENLGISLLGQSFLTRLDSYEMHDGVLTLSYW